MVKKLLIANRGEIAIRIARAAQELGVPCVAVYAQDDARCLHVRRADAVHALPGVGARAYLDTEALIAAARHHDCDAVHPGYGFVSESADFAEACEQAGLTFVGPTPETLRRLGDKTRARSEAVRLGVPVLEGSEAGLDTQAAKAFMAALGEGASVVVKAVAGGGGRGMRLVRAPDELPGAMERCSAEALAAFGDGSVYLERYIEQARHVEVQIVGDGSGAVSHLHERECTLQRRYQKLVEMAPSPDLDPGLRDALTAAAVCMAQDAHYRSLGTFEFLLDRERPGGFSFIEANPRLQVEHTVTEEVTGVDLVQVQLCLAAGSSLAELGLEQAQIGVPFGFAIQVRVNMETMQADGSTRPGGGTLQAFDPPTGPGLRVDTLGYTGYVTSPNYDSLLAKVIASVPGDDFGGALARCRRALEEFRIEGVATNRELLHSLLQHPAVAEHRVTNTFIGEHILELLHGEAPRARFFEDELPSSGVASGLEAAKAPETDDTDEAGAVAMPAPMQGTVVSLQVQPGAAVHKGDALLIMDAMKMEHVICAEQSGHVRRFAVSAGQTVQQGETLLTMEPAELGERASDARQALDLEHIRPDLAASLERHALGHDEQRPEAVAKRHGRGHRTARENLAQLVDEDSFVEYGPLVIAAQRRRRELQELMERTPADGLVGGVGSINGALFGPDQSQCVVMSYDYMVLAGTQGHQNHRKKDRMFELAERARLPVVFFTEGGGGRPGDTDVVQVAGLDCLAFAHYGKLSGLVPLVAIVNGRCFAGNAALAGCSDVVIATQSANLGMGGPAMIEGGGLGVFTPEQVGPMEVQVPNGVVDVLVKDEAEAVEVAKRYLSYFQGSVAQWSCPDQRLLRSAIPENRLRVYEMRDVIETLADSDSVLELRKDFGAGMITALARVEGRPVGIVANNPKHLGGAIDRDAADKAARFMQLCDAHDLPLLFLCDTPGIMVGPAAEATALVRHVSRLFITGASLTVPFFTIITRKAYGLGAQTMAGGSFKSPFFVVAWPTGELGGMGLEGAVKLGFRKELEAIEDPAERKQAFDAMVNAAYQYGTGANVAAQFEFDDVIDPVDSRRWIMSALRSAPTPPPREGKKRPCVDSW